MEEASQSLSIPAKMGVVTGMLYCVFIFVENQFFYHNPLQFGAAKGLFYLVVIGGILYTGILIKKENGGFIYFRDVLKAMLLAIAITELFYVIFNIVYVKWIDPAFIDKLKASYQVFYQAHNVPAEQVADQMQRFEDAGKITFWGMIELFGFSIIIDAVFAVIFAAILKKNKPFFENQT